jgi:hypothetical protein
MILCSYTVLITPSTSKTGVQVHCTYSRERNESVTTIRLIRFARFATTCTRGLRYYTLYVLFRRRQGDLPLPTLPVPVSYFCLSVV